MFADHRDRLLNFSLIFYSSVGLSMGIQPAKDSVSEILHSAAEDILSLFESKIGSQCQSVELTKQTCISPKPGAKANRQGDRVG